MAYGTLTFPQSGSYTLSWGIMYGNGTTTYNVGASNKTTVTYGASSITVTNPNGTTSTYTYTESNLVYAHTSAGVQIFILQLTGGGYLVLADPSVDLTKITFTSVGAYQFNLSGDYAGLALTTGHRDPGWNGICFLSGTLISTPSVQILVEDIVPGTEILTFDKKGNAIVKKVCWVGSNKVSIENPEFELNKHPVRIKKDAFADNVPFKDCLITPEHCLFIDGCFIPARMLVNDKSIYFDRTINEYEYFHIELEDHSILCSDGIYSESYLRTNELEFSSSEGTSAASTKTWAQDAAVPLNVTRDFVEPIYQKLALRADMMDFPCVEKKILKALKTYIVDQYGNMIYPSRVSGNKYSFYLKDGSDNIFIRSGSGKPSEVVGSFVDDRRKLGLLIGEITLLTSDNFTKYTQHLEGENLFGWYDRECNTMRWTNGNAQLLNLGMTKSCYICIEIIDRMPSVERIDLTTGSSQDPEMIATVV